MSSVTVNSKVATTSRRLTHLDDKQHRQSNTMSLSRATPMATSSIPSFYRFSLLYAEPFFALGGAIILYFNPATFLTTMTASPPPPASTLTTVRVLTDQLAAMQVLMAFYTGVVLRLAVDDQRRRWIWRICCMGMLICDVLHVAASARELGWEVMVAPREKWRMEEWVNFGILGWMALVRLCVMLGIGMGEESVEEERQRNGLAKSAANGKKQR